jgi:hypothetical protein
MRGDDLLLAHLAALPGLDDEEDGDDAEPRETPRERLEAEVGPELAATLLEGLASGR